MLRHLPPWEHLGGLLAAFCGAGPKLFGGVTFAVWLHTMQPRAPELVTAFQFNGIKVSTNHKDDDDLNY